MRCEVTGGCSSGFPELLLSRSPMEPRRADSNVVLMKSTDACEARDRVRRMGERGYALLIMSTAGGVTAFAVPAAGSEPLYAVRCFDGARSDMDAVTLAISELYGAITAALRTGSEGASRERKRLGEGGNSIPWCN